MGTSMIWLKLFAAHACALALVGSLAPMSALTIAQAAPVPVMAAGDGVVDQGQDVTDLPLPALMGAGALVGGLLAAVALYGSGSESCRGAR